MMNITTPDTIFLIIAFFVPGYVMLLSRSQFVIETLRNGQEFLLKILGYSCLNYALMCWAIYLLLSIKIPVLGGAALWLLILLISPAVIGTLWGISVQKEWGYKIFRKLGLSPVHITPSAWDWKFNRMQGSYVLVTLKNGTKYAGWCERNSFMSSNPNERDMYIEKMYDLPEGDEPWKDRGNDSVLICANEIRTVEFINSNKQEKDDE